MEERTAEEKKESFEYASRHSAVDVSNRFRGYFGCNILDFYSHNTIMEMAKDPMTYNAEVRRLSRILYSSNGILTNVIDYCVALPVLSSVVVPHGKAGAKKKVNKELVIELLNVIRDKEFIRDGIHNALIEGVYFGYLETKERPLDKATSMTDWDVESIAEINESQINAAIIYLNPDYTRIVGIKNGSYVLAFDLDYFMLNDNETPENKIRKFPEEIRKAYAKYRSGTGQRWAVLNNDHTIAVKFRAKKAEPYGRPLALAAIDDILYDAYKTKVKRATLAAVNNRIIYETFPEGKNKGESALTGKQQEDQHNTVRDAITRPISADATTFFSVAAGTKIDVLKPDVSVFDNDDDNSSKRAISTSLGFAGSLLSGDGTSSFSSQENNLRLITAEVFQIIELLTEELNKAINRCVIKNPKYKTEVKYLPITYANRKEFAEMSKDLYLQGKGPLTLWAAAVGIEPDAFYAMMDEELENNVEEKYPVHKTSFTQGNDSNQGGRPVDEDTSNEKTLYSRETGGMTPD